MIMVFSLITSGGKPSEMVPRTCFVCGGTLTPARCPVRATEEYVAFARRLGVSLTQGYLFRPADQRGTLLIRPFLVLPLNID